MPVVSEPVYDVGLLTQEVSMPSRHISDINSMKEEIETARVAVMDVRENDPKDEVDEQWNTCIDNSVKLMEKRIDQLNTLSKSPPGSSS